MAEFIPHNLQQLQSFLSTINKHSEALKVQANNCLGELINVLSEIDNPPLTKNEKLISRYYKSEGKMPPRKKNNPVKKRKIYGRSKQQKRSSLHTKHTIKKKSLNRSNIKPHIIKPLSKQKLTTGNRLERDCFYDFLRDIGPDLFL